MKDCSTLRLVLFSAFWLIDRKECLCLKENEKRGNSRLYPIFFFWRKNKKTLPDGIEPSTSRLTAERSNQLSYGRFWKKVLLFPICRPTTEVGALFGTECWNYPIQLNYSTLGPGRLCRLSDFNSRNEIQDYTAIWREFVAFFHVFFIPFTFLLSFSIAIRNWYFLLLLSILVFPRYSRIPRNKFEWYIDWEGNHSVGLSKSQDKGCSFSCIPAIRHCTILLCPRKNYGVLIIKWKN